MSRNPSQSVPSPPTPLAIPLEVVPRDNVGLFVSMITQDPDPLSAQRFVDEKLLTKDEANIINAGYHRFIPAILTTTIIAPLPALYAFRSRLNRSSSRIGTVLALSPSGIVVGWLIASTMLHNDMYSLRPHPNQASTLLLTYQYLHGVGSPSRLPPIGQPLFNPKGQANFASRREPYELRTRPSEDYAEGPVVKVLTDVARKVKSWKQG